MKHKLLNKLLFLTLMTWGGGVINPAWADEEEVNVLTADFNDGSASGWTLSGKTSYAGSAGAKSLQIASGQGAGSAQTPTFSSLVGTTATLTFSLRSSGSSTKTLTITGNSCKVAGGSSTTALTSSSTVTIAITEASTSSSITFSAVKNGGCIIDDVRVYYVTNADPSSEAAFAEETPSINFPATTTYLQPLSTAEGYTGTKSYEITANTAGATINAETGLVTVTQGGSVTVKGTAHPVTGFSGSTATYTLTVNDTRTSAGLAWSAASANVTYGDDSNVFPTLTNTHNVAVTYSSTNETAATIDESGAITLNDITATTSIRATFAGDDDYLPQTVSYTLNVTKGPFVIKDGVFDFVEAGAENKDYGSGVSLTSSNSYYNYDETTWTAGNVTMVVSGKYRWWNNDKTLRLYTYTPNSAATFSVPSGFVITKIVTTGAGFSNADVGTLNTSTWTWTGSAQDVKLSIGSSNCNFKTFTITYAETATIGDAGYTTYVAKRDISFPDGVTAYISTTKTSTTLTLTAKSSVPANTPVILQGSAGTYVLPTITTTPDDVTGNLLLASDGTVTGGEGIYALSKQGGVVGFYPVDGGVTIPAGKAYLNTSILVKAFTFEFEDDADGINSLTPALSEGEGAIYNLAGQRMNKMQKGINIINGKKVLK